MKKSRTNSKTEVESLNKQFIQLYKQGRYKDALKIANKSYERAYQALDKESLPFATSLNNLAELYQDMGKYAEAESYYQQALEIYRKVLGDKYPEVAISLNNLAVLYRLMGKYTEAEPHYWEALEICRKALGEEHPDVAISLNNLAELYGQMGNYVEAERLLIQSLELKKRLLGQKHSKVATSLNNLAALYQEMGNYAKAETFYQQALKIYRKALGEGHPDVATSLNNLAELYQDMGNYAKAEPLCRRALEIRCKALGEEHPDVAASLNNLAVLYRVMGNYAEAEPRYQQALEIYRKAFGDDNPEVATSLNNLAVLYCAMGNYTKAEPHYRQVLKICRKAFGEGHPKVAASLDNLAGLYKDMGNYGEAESHYRQALEIYRQALGEDNPDVARSFNNLAELYREMGNYAKAEIFCQQALEIYRQALGKEHPDVATGLNNLAVLYWAMGSFTEAISLLLQASAITDNTIGQIFSIGSENTRKVYLKITQSKLAGCLSLLIQSFKDSQPELQAVFDLVLRRKAIGAEALAAQQDALLGGRYPQLKSQLSELVTLRNQIAQKTLAGPGAEDSQVYQQRLAQWKQQQEQLEAELASQIPEMNLTKKLQSANRNAVALKLPTDSVLVEFVGFDVFDPKAIPAQGEKQWKPERYVAFVLHTDEPNQIQLIDFGEAEPIHQMITSFRIFITREREASDRTLTNSDKEVNKRFARPETPLSTPLIDNGCELRAKIFDPLLPAIGNCKRLFLAPDGDLSRIPFEVLPTEDGQHLIDHYTISYFSSGRDILRLGASSTGEPTPPIVAADPDFDLDNSAFLSTPLSEAEECITPKIGLLDGGLVLQHLGRVLKDLKSRFIRPFNELPEASDLSISPDQLPRDFDRAIHFGRLIGTRKEGERIAQILSVKPWLGSEVRETPLKSCHSPQILHIATHGFFLPSQRRDPNEDKLSIVSMMNTTSEGPIERLSGSRLENPLLRSGLALAGANTWLNNGSLPEDAEDGILTAEDVTAMDLLSTEMVVLSACETGLGEVQTGEGVFGLRRSFVLAGAKTLVMSLWKVPDKQTQELMEEFYERILADQPRAEALRGAQLEMKKRYPEPLYWGAFICQGDPSPLKTRSHNSIGFTWKEAVATDNGIKLEGHCS